MKCCWIKPIQLINPALAPEPRCWISFSFLVVYADLQLFCPQRTCGIGIIAMIMIMRRSVGLKKLRASKLKKNSFAFFLLIERCFLLLLFWMAFQLEGISFSSFLWFCGWRWQPAAAAAAASSSSSCAAAAAAAVPLLWYRLGRFGLFHRRSMAAVSSRSALRISFLFLFFISFPHLTRLLPPALSIHLDLSRFISIYLRW